MIQENLNYCLDVPGKITFKESDALSPGNTFTTFDTPWCKVEWMGPLFPCFNNLKRPIF